MGIEPFLIASTVHTVIGQRLVRRLADNQEAYQSNIAETEALMAGVGRLLPKADRRSKENRRRFRIFRLASDRSKCLYFIQG